MAVLPLSPKNAARACAPGSTSQRVTWLCCSRSARASSAAAARSCRTGVAERSSTTEQGAGTATLTRAPTAATSASALSADSWHTGRRQSIRCGAWFTGSQAEMWGTPGRRAGFFQTRRRRRNKECTACMASRAAALGWPVPRLASGMASPLPPSRAAKRSAAKVQTIELSRFGQAKRAVAAAESPQGWLWGLEPVCPHPETAPGRVPGTAEAEGEIVAAREGSTRARDRRAGSRRWRGQARFPLPDPAMRGKLDE
jgi:hypothetical protein